MAVTPSACLFPYPGYGSPGWQAASCQLIHSCRMKCTETAGDTSRREHEAAEPGVNAGKPSAPLRRGDRGCRGVRFFMGQRRVPRDIRHPHRRCGTEESAATVFSPPFPSRQAFATATSFLLRCQYAQVGCTAVKQKRHATRTCTTSSTFFHLRPVSGTQPHRSWTPQRIAPADTCPARAAPPSARPPARSLSIGKDADGILIWIG